MAKATDAQIRNAKEAMAGGGALPKGIRINFGDPEPIQKASGDDKPAATSGTTSDGDKK